MRVKDYEALYDLPAGEYDGRGVDGVRTVTVRAGASLEVMCCPVVRMTEGARRELKRRKTSPAMARINARNTERHMMRLFEHNFTPEAVVVTLTYAYPVGDYAMMNLDELAEAYERVGAPWDVDRVWKDKKNLIDKLKRRVLRAGGRLEDFKWVTRIEEGKEPPRGGLPRKYHLHGVFEGPGITREVIEALWPHGWVDAKRFDLRDDGAARLARYLCKQKTGGRWWSHSRNLKEPPRTVSERKISRRKLGRIAADVYSDGRQIFEGLYPGYKVMEVCVSYSDFCAGAYIYARLRRREACERGRPMRD